MNPLIPALVFGASIVGAMIAYCQLFGCNCDDCRG